MAVSFLLILLAVLLCVGCHEHGTHSNVMENSTRNVGQNRLLGTTGLGSLHQCQEEQKLSVACMDPTNLDEGNVSCPALSVKREGSSKCGCGNHLHGKITCVVSAKMDMLLPCICTVCSASNAQKTII